MAVVKIPFCSTKHLAPPFMLDEDYCQPNGVKSILLDKSDLEIIIKRESVSVPDIGLVEMCVFYVVGMVHYICNVFPIVQCAPEYDVIKCSSVFNSTCPSSACVAATPCCDKAWLSVSGCVNVDKVVGASCQIDEAPTIDNVTIEDIAVCNNLTSTMEPLCEHSCGEEDKRIVKWRGCLVITTTDD